MQWRGESAGQEVIFKIHLRQQVLELELAIDLQASELVIEDPEFGMLPECCLQRTSEFRCHAGSKTGSDPSIVWADPWRQIPGFIVCFPEVIREFEPGLGEIEGRLVVCQLEGLQLRQGLCGVEGRSIALCVAGSHQPESLTADLHGISQDPLYLIRLHPVPVTQRRFMQQVIDGKPPFPKALIPHDAGLAENSPALVHQQVLGDRNTDPEIRRPAARQFRVEEIPEVSLKPAGDLYAIPGGDAKFRVHVLIVILAVEGLTFGIHAEDGIEPRPGGDQTCIGPINDDGRLTCDRMKGPHQVQEGFLRQGAVRRLSRCGGKAHMDQTINGQEC